MTLLRVMAAALVASCAAQALPTSAQTAKFPARLDEYLTKTLTPDQRAKLLAGQPVTKLLESDPSREVAVLGAIWVKAPIGRYVAAVTDIETFEKGPSFRVTKKISDPPRLEDFAALTLPPDDLADLKTCRVGSCELKLGENALNRMRKEIDWSKSSAPADADRLARQLMMEYSKGYLEGGNARLAVYRDSGRPTFVAQEFTSMVERTPALSEYLPELKRYLLDYPKATLPNSHSFLYWQEAKFGLKPTLRVNHLTGTEEPTHVAVVSKMLYASHYFWSAIELRVLVPDPARGDGFWFVSVNRSRSDGLSGFTGSLIRGKVRGEAEKGMQAVLAITKTKLEGEK